MMISNLSYLSSAATSDIRGGTSHTTVISVTSCYSYGKIVKCKHEDGKVVEGKVTETEVKDLIDNVFDEIKDISENIWNEWVDIFPLY